MPSDRAAVRFEDILDSIARIGRYTAGYDLRRFSEDTFCQDAVQFCLLRISEAARVLDTDAERLAPDIPWRDIRGLGNRLRHEYQKLDMPLIWRIVEKDITPLETACKHALERLRKP